ncbi:protein ORFE5B [Equid gammaherpesvirus 5]|nr:protein ORFE5B [Equid gammaherpesvirus 5]
MFSPAPPAPLTHSRSDTLARHPSFLSPSLPHLIPKHTHTQSRRSRLGASSPFAAAPQKRGSPHLPNHNWRETGAVKSLRGVCLLRTGSAAAGGRARAHPLLRMHRGVAGTEPLSDKQAKGVYFLRPGRRPLMALLVGVRENKAFFSLPFYTTHPPPPSHTHAHTRARVPFPRSIFSLAARKTFLPFLKWGSETPEGRGGGVCGAAGRGPPPWPKPRLALFDIFFPKV